MLQAQSQNSVPEIQCLRSTNLPKISSKVISKSKNEKTQMSKQILLANQQLKQLNIKHFIVAQIRQNNCMDPSQDDIIHLGRLYLDHIAYYNKILERRLENEIIECKLSPSNFHSENTGLIKIRQLPAENHIYIYKYVPQEIQKNFEESLSLPYECVQIIYENCKIVSLTKRMNYDFIRIMGINFDILDDYISKYNQMPKGLNHTSLIWFDQEKKFSGQYINYQGEQFQVKIEFKKFLFQCKQSYLHECLIYMIVHCDRKYLNIQNIENNYLDYFKVKNLSNEEKRSIHQSRIQKECIIKPIITKLNY